VDGRRPEVLLLPLSFFFFLLLLPLLLPPPSTLLCLLHPPALVAGWRRHAPALRSGDGEAQPGGRRG